MPKVLGFAIVLAILVSSAAQKAAAECFGSDTFKTCTDESGNAYTVETYGAMTVMRGTNASNGTAWSQSSETYGGSTFTRGTSADGGSWNMTQNRYGGGVSTYGTDSNGNAFNSFCSSAICN